MRHKLRIILFIMLAAGAHAEPNVQTTRISHGIAAWYVENPSVPVVDIQLSFEGAGTVSDPAGKAGRASFAAAMLTEGAGTFTSQQFQQQLDENAITLEVNAGVDRLDVHIHCLRENAAKAGELLAAALTSPTLTEPDIARVKTQLAGIFLQMEESPEYQAQRLLEARAFRNHPYASPAFGTPESVAMLNAQDIRDYLNLYVTRDNLIIAAAGDVDRHLLETVLTPLVDGLKANEAGPVSITKISPQGGGEIFRQRSDLPQTVIAFVAPGIGRNDPRFYTAYLLNHILGGDALMSRLSNDVRQKKGLVYSINTELDTRLGTSLLSGALATRNSSSEVALAEVKSVIQNLHDHGVTEEECKDAKSYMLGHFPLQMDSSASVAQMLSTMQVNHLGEHYLHDRIADFDKVSCSDITTLASEMLVPDKFLFAIVGGVADTGPAPGAATRSDTH